MTTLSGHQPCYLPGIILFNKIALSDKFMFVGQCQASPGTWHNRNQIRGARLTIPVKNDFGVSINDTEFVSYHWKRKHLKSIELAYSKAPFFKKYFSKLSTCINEPWQRLGPMNMALIELLCIWFEIETEILDGRDYNMETFDDPNDMLIDMCEAVGADEYLSNEGSRDYVNENKLATAGIDHKWQVFVHPVYEQFHLDFLRVFVHPVYEQFHLDFLADLSAIDILFNKGPEAGRIIRDAGHVA